MHEVTTGANVVCAYPLYHNRNRTRDADVFARARIITQAVIGVHAALMQILPYNLSLSSDQRGAKAGRRQSRAAETLLHAELRLSQCVYMNFGIFNDP